MDSRYGIRSGEAKEVIEGATCTLSGAGSGYSITTDGFGDFWFEGLDVGYFIQGLR